MNILTALTLISEVHPTRNPTEDYIATVQNICAEALANPELTPSEAAHFFTRSTRNQNTVAASRANGALAGATHRRNAAKRKESK